jgi:hypothetical protein
MSIADRGVEGVDADGSPSLSGGRDLAERAFLPVREVFEEFGDMMILAGRTLSSAVSPPYP